MDDVPVKLIILSRGDYLSLAKSLGAAQFCGKQLDHIQSGNRGMSSHIYAVHHTGNNS